MSCRDKPLTKKLIRPNLWTHVFEASRLTFLHRKTKVEFQTLGKKRALVCCTISKVLDSISFLLLPACYLLHGFSRTNVTKGHKWSEWKMFPTDTCFIFFVNVPLLDKQMLVCMLDKWPYVNKIWTCSK